MEFKELIEHSELLTFKEIEEDDGKRMQVTACVQQADIVNRNNRLYSRDVLESAADQYQTKVEGGKAFGQTDHPDMKGKLRDTSHLIKSLEWRGQEEDPTGKQNLLVGEMIILRTPSGQALAEIIRAGGRPGISSRGRGESKETVVNGTKCQKIQPGFKFDGFDFVVDPSVESAEIKRYSERVTDAARAFVRESKTKKPEESINYLARALRAVEKAEPGKKAEPKPVSEDEVKELTKRMAR